MSDLFGIIEEIKLRDQRSDVTVSLGEFFKKNPKWGNIRASDEDEIEEFIDADPNDDGAEFLEMGRRIILPFEQFDMPSPGDVVRIDVVSR